MFVIWTYKNQSNWITFKEIKSRGAIFNNWPAYFADHIFDAAPAYTEEKKCRWVTDWCSTCSRSALIFWLDFKLDPFKSSYKSKRALRET